MNLLDIFNSDAFALTNLTAAIQKVKYTPNKISSMGLYTPEGINTTSVMIDVGNDSVGIVPAKERGSIPSTVIDDKIQSIPFKLLHLPQRHNLLADELIGRRQMGTTDQTKSIERVRNRLLGKHRRNIELTLEGFRLGGIKGQLLNKDGSVLLDLYDAMGEGAQETVNFAFSNAVTKPAVELDNLEIKIEEALDGVAYSGLQILAGKDWMNAFVSNEKVEESWLRFRESGMLRESKIGPSGFEYGNWNIVRYRGGAGVTIADDEAFAFPMGVDEMFIERFGPADYMESVGMDGMDFVSKAEMMPFGKGITVESQSNPIMINTRPSAVKRLTFS